MYRKHLYLAAAFIFVLVHLGISNEITFNQNFDSGSLLVEDVVVEGDRVTLAGRDNFNPGGWKWLHFEATGVKERLLRFEIGDNFATGSNSLSDLQMVYSYDRENWLFFDQNQWKPDAAKYTFRNDEPFSEDRVVIAFSFPYPYRRVVEHMESINDSPWVLPTSSADLDLVIGQSSGGVDCGGRDVPAHNLFGFVITDPSVEGPKIKISITGGVHANEVLGNHVLESLINFLISDDPQAANMREAAEVFVYPMVNPDGRYAGYNRGGVQHERRDSNRYWHEDLYQDMDEIRTVAEALLHDTGGNVSWHFDFHSWSNTAPHFCFLSEEALHTTFWKVLKELEPKMAHRVSNGDAKTGRWFGKHRLNGEFSLTAETMFRPGEDLDRYRRMGKHFAIALAQEIAAAKMLIAK